MTPLPTLEIRVDGRVAGLLGHGPLDDALRGTATATLARLGWWEGAGPVPVTVTAGAPAECSLLVDGHPLALSARRRERVAIAASGCHRAPGDERPPSQVAAERWAAAGPAEAARLVRWSVEALLTLPGALWSQGDGPDAIDRAVALADRLGFPPAVLAADGGTSVEADADPLLAIDARAAALATTPVVLRASRATLRRLTAGAAPLRSTMLYRRENERSLPRGAFDDLWTDHGARCPGLALEEDPSLPDGLVRTALGPVWSIPTLLWADDLVAVRNPDGEGAGRVLDPISGELRGLLPTGAADGGMPAARYLLRAMHADLLERLAWYTPTAVERWPLRGDLAARVARLLPALRRMLAADRASVQLDEPLAEATLRALAGGGGLDEAYRAARALLGSGVLGPVPVAQSFRLVAVSAETAAAATRRGSTGPIFETHPKVLDEPLVSVVVAPAGTGETLRRLLRPFVETVVVLDEEFVTEGEMRILSELASRRVPVDVLAASRMSSH